MSNFRHKIDAYGYLFNALKFNFNVEETVSNFCNFFDNVYCATVTSEDSTREILFEMEEKYSNFHVIDTNVKILGNNLFDGQLKTIAMNKCKNQIRAIVDFDEMFPLSNRVKWDYACDRLMENKFVDGLLIPTIDCFKSKEKIRLDSQIGLKFRLHKDSVYARGVPNFAKRGDGLFYTEKSDSTDPITQFGELCKFESIVPPILLNSMFTDQLINFPYSLHYGSIDLSRRAKIGKEFWKQAWEERSGRNENVVTDVRELEEIKTIYHNLPLE